MRSFALLLCGLVGCSSAVTPARQDPGDPSVDPVAGDDAGADDPGNAADGGSPRATRAVQIIVEPDGRAGKQVIDAIAGAKRSVHMTMYLLTSNDIVGALVARKKAGIDVRVVLNHNLAQGADNEPAYAQLRQAGVDVRWAPSGFALTHEKCFVVDGQSAWIMTMNAAYSPPTSNREFLAIDTDPSDVAEAEAIFEGDFAGAPASVSGSLVVAPNNASARVLSLIQSAKATLDVEVEELSDYRVTDALANASARGVKVRVVIPNNTPTPAEQTAIGAVKSAGAKIVETTTPYIHAKAIVADGAVAFIGSENLTLPSLKYNRELGLVFDAPSEVQKVSAAIAADFAKGTAL